jgi:hypothetical protein
VPSNRNKRTRNRSKLPGLPGAVCHCLLTGSYFSQERVTEDEKRQYWAWYRDEVINYWTQDPHTWVRGELCHWDYPDPAGPGHRPYAFWKWDAEERRLLDVDVLRELEKRLLGEARYSDINLDLLRQESEFEYLHRHGLLTKAERQWFARFPQVSFDDWCLLFRQGWQCETARTNHIRLWHRCLTEKGNARARLELAYWNRLGLKWSPPENMSAKIFDVGYNKVRSKE